MLEGVKSTLEIPTYMPISPMHPSSQPRRVYHCSVLLEHSIESAIYTSIIALETLCNSEL